MLKCPYGCGLNTDLFIRNHPEVQEAGVRIMICPLCEQQIKIVTVFLPSYTCEKVEELSLWQKAKKTIYIEIDRLITRFWR